MFSNTQDRSRCNFLLMMNIVYQCPQSCLPCYQWSCHYPCVPSYHDLFIINVYHYRVMINIYHDLTNINVHHGLVMINVHHVNMILSWSMSTMLPCHVNQCLLCHHDLVMINVYHVTMILLWSMTYHYLVKIYVYHVTMILLWSMCTSHDQCVPVMINVYQSWSILPDSQNILSQKQWDQKMFCPARCCSWCSPDIRTGGFRCRSSSSSSPGSWRPRSSRARPVDSWTHLWYFQSFGRSGSGLMDWTRFWWTPVRWRSPTHSSFWNHLFVLLAINGPARLLTNAKAIQ